MAHLIAGIHLTVLGILLFIVPALLARATRSAAPSAPSRSNARSARAESGPLTVAAYCAVCVGLAVVVVGLAKM